MIRQEVPYSGDERALLVAMLDFQRETMTTKLEGLSDEQARFEPTPPENSLGGLVRHLAYVERWWFRQCFLGEELPVPYTDDDPDADFRVPQDQTVDEILAFYRESWARSNEIIGAASLDDTTVIPARRGHPTMRWILLHMIEETARHAGHADITRELIDGSKGL